MKCEQCGTEFEGKFCPECGAKAPDAATAESVPVQQPKKQAVPVGANSPVKKKKKPIYLSWWFFLVVIAAVVVVVVAVTGGGEKIRWSEMELGHMLPEPPSNKGVVYTNSSDKLYVNIENVSDSQYNDYLDLCIEKGFTIDSKKDSSSYEAYNSEGYSLDLSYYSYKTGKLSIELEAPMEFASITWPTGEAGKRLPAPKSAMGKFSYEHDDSFFVYITDTTRDDYDEYVKLCSESGFSVDYDKGEDYYYADDSEGWHISVKYEGNNIMSVSISAPDEEEEISDNSETLTAETEPDVTEETQNTEPATEAEETAAEENEGGSGGQGLDPDFKAAMDSYEAFIDEYVAFMKKYSENPSDLGLIADYANYISKYAEMVEDFNKWEDEELTAEEFAYYIEVQSRVSSKLLEIAQLA